MPNILDSFLSLARNVNKVKPEEAEQQEGIVGEKVSVLSLDKSDDELLALKKSWELKWEKSDIRKEIERKQEENEKYWLGDHFTIAQKVTRRRELVDNLIFESIETALPVYTKQIAQPMVTSSKEPSAQLLARKVSDRIIDVADVIRLRLKVKKAVRYWALYFLGVIKLGYSLEKNEIVAQAIRPQQLILDPEAITDECEYEGSYLGHYRTDTADDLISRFPTVKEKIIDEVGKDKLGTKIRYIEWWTNEYLFWSLKGIILGKAKNPHWNYNEEQDVPIIDEAGQPIIDENGNQKISKQIINKGVNHFSSPKIPFSFLSVFNLGKGPYDNTNPVEQVIPLQDKVNKRVRQIDKNADNTNSGAVVSGDSFSKEQAKEVGEALRKGQTVWVPRGNVEASYKRDVAPPLPAFMYQDLIDSRNEVRGVFGVTGLSAQGIKSEETVRGKIVVRDTDTDRAAPIVEHIEQFYDYIFNWIVQFMMVYYDEPRAVNKSQGSEVISSADFVYPLVVSVKEGSLIPKDRLTQRNEAIELFQVGAMDPLTLAERLELPDPKEFVRRLILWKQNPMGLIPEFQSQQETGPPAETPEVMPGSMPGAHFMNEEEPEKSSNLLKEQPI